MARGGAAREWRTSSPARSHRRAVSAGAEDTARLSIFLEGRAHMNKIAGVILAAVGAVALAGIALHRHEPINALWIVTAAVCVYALGYRFYAAWVAARVLAVD